MTTSTIQPISGSNPHLTEDQALLPAVVEAVRAAGKQMLSLFDPASRLESFDALLSAIHANDAASLAVLRPALEAARPGAGWVEDELESGALPPGEWWITDPVEGNINHIHGLSDWGVTATLLRGNRPVLTVVYLPLSDTTYSAVLGAGAYENGVRLSPSVKTELKSAMVGTGQARPGESQDTHRLMGLSVTAMLEHALVVRVSVPATLQLIQVAAGRMDAFWQHSQVRSGLLAGALLVAEAGGLVTDMRGQPWTLESGGFLASAPALHGQAVNVLSGIE